MCTGLSPFQGSSATTVSFKVANREPVAASALDMTLPPQLDAVISSAIAKNPDQRYQTGHEFAEDLRILQQSSKPGSTSTSLQAAATGTRGLSTRSGKTASVDVRPVAALAQVHTALRGILFKASLRDLILGAATVVLLVILVAQSKLLVTSAPTAAATSPRGVSSSAASSDSAKPTSPPVEPAPAVPPTVGAAKGTRAKAPAKVPSSAPREAGVPSATLDIVVQHQFKDATLFVWVDGKLALTRPLHGAAQKKLVVFNGVRGVESETMKVSAGKHALRFRALSGDQTTDLSKTIAADFVGGQDKSLQVTFDRHNTMMRLTWQ